MSGSARPLLRSFAGGEITAELYGRLDLEHGERKGKRALARSRHFRQKPPSQRPGRLRRQRAMPKAPRRGHEITRPPSRNTACGG